MQNEKKILYFLSCDIEEDAIKSIENDNRVISMYHVCGNTPWLLVCKFSSFDDAHSFNSNYCLDIKNMLIANLEESKESENIPEHPEHYELKSWIFIWMPQNFCFDIKDVESQFKITKKYQIFGKQNYLVKFYTTNIGYIDSFLDICKDKNMITSTYIVLRTIKEEGLKINQEVEVKKHEVENIKKNEEYLFARIVANSKGFIEKNREEQIKEIEAALDKMGFVYDLKKFIPEIGLTKDEYNRDALEHPNKLINRYSIKLNKECWVKALFFFQARPKKKEELLNSLKNNLLGVEQSYFSRKLYHMAGQYDFVVILDFKDSASMKLKSDYLCTEYQHLIKDFRSVLCEPEKQGKEISNLEKLAIPFIQSLLINSTDMSMVLDKIKKSIKEILDKDPMPLAELGITPREDYVRGKIWQSCKDKIVQHGCVISFLEKFHSLSDIGVESAIEFNDGALIQALFRFYLKDTTSKSELITKIRKKIENFEIIATIYEPNREPLGIRGIFMVKDIKELQLLYEEFQKFCNKIEFHMLFHQHFYSKVIEKSVKCRPCFYPNAKQDCGKCIRYLLPRKKDRTLNINFNQKIKENVKISLVGLNLDFDKYFALNKKCDQINVKKIFGKLKQLNPKYEGHYGNLQKNYEYIANQGLDNYRTNYSNKLIEILKKLILECRSDMIVFPEYSIPFNIYSSIKNTIRAFQERVVIILGSYIDDNGFNISPVMFVNDKEGHNEIYHCYRNTLCPLEKKLKENNDEIGLENIIMISEGTAYLKFLNTQWGNFCVRLCYESLDPYVDKSYENLDILFIPSFNHSKMLPDKLKEHPRDFKLVVVYSNTPDVEGSIPSEFLLPPNDGKIPLYEKVQPFHKGQWPERIKEYRNDIKVFSITNLPPIDDDKEFIFKVQHLVIHNLIELDIRREIRSS